MILLPVLRTIIWKLQLHFPSTLCYELFLHFNCWGRGLWRRDSWWNFNVGSDNYRIHHYYVTFSYIAIFYGNAIACILKSSNCKKISQLKRELNRSQYFRCQCVLTKKFCCLRPSIQNITFKIWNLSRRSRQFTRGT